MNFVWFAIGVLVGVLGISLYITMELVIREFEKEKKEGKP